jgi:hypothetical protein
MTLTHRHNSINCGEKYVDEGKPKREPFIRYLLHCFSKLGGFIKT